jgi:peptidoglycan/xylan/chitin deacetylase (PgdA/CDA1 family)
MHAPPSVAILGYHKIGAPPPGGWASWFYVPESTFAAQLEALRDDGYEVLDLRRFLGGLADPGTLPARSVLLTFDDGYRSMRTVALPWLERFDAPAVLFVPVDHVGGRNTFDSGIEPDEEICDWNDLGVLAAAGVTIQSHAASHTHLSELSPEIRAAELLRSKAVLEERLGEAVETIAFPYGDPGPDGGMQLAACGYRAAFLYGGGPLPLPAADPYRLPRIAMGPDTNLTAELKRAMEPAGIRT